MDNRIAFLYVITRIRTGQRYVEVTVNANKRWSHHRWLTRSGRSTQLIHRAMAKYGLKAFRFEVVACSRNWADGVAAEQQLIEQNGSYVANGGYNLTIGGEGPAGRKCSAETRARISAANSGRRGRKISEEEKLASRSRLIALRAADPNAFAAWAKKGGGQLGRVNSDETKSRMRASALKRWASERSNHPNPLRVTQHH